MSQFMTWYSQAGTPGLVCDLKYDAGKRQAELTIEQVLSPTPGQPTKKPLHMPLALGLLGGNGNDLPLELQGVGALESGILELTKRKETFRFVDVPSRPVPSLLRGFSAPVNLMMDLADADLAFLMAHDSDEFNRWQACQDYALRLLVASVHALEKKQPAPNPKAFIDALGVIATDERLEPAYRAQVLALPSESDIARTIARDIDPDAIHKARRTLRRKIAQRLAPQLEVLYRQHTPKGAYEPTPEQIGLRSLRSMALGLLTARGKPEDLERANRHFEKAGNDKSGNLTDELAGLGVLIDVKGPIRTAALERFFERWKGDHIVIDHWFGYQAASALPGTLGTVKKLMTHPLMSLENPNKVRTLLGAFAANSTAFNAADGSGYAFVAENCLIIDKFNPQMSARLLTAFRSWRTLEPGRRKLAEKTLKKVVKAKGLSRDAYEIVSKMLDA